MTGETNAPRPAPQALLLHVRDRIRIVHARIERGELDAARALLAEIDESLGRGASDAEAPDPARHDAQAEPAGAASHVRMTPAELRLLPFLRTHLTLAQIGERLFVSRNTVSSQATAVYRKLSVGSRAAAVDEAIRRGLLVDDTQDPFA
ncbi:LuxR C-terminal-related transcriptional regulator [Microbacterium sp. 13-71-7]|jgi:LuxR family maltose regulon positive regulatory protein|uniref:helix-turn-helix transcriptional regulator n=1 Tax=Microbacterium sp. 13-71-7 TaxID=1970399 RepID=UPI0025CBD431|nr:LuxR C-terminal-related transcriptional regulator [Microbacterium sp. 13-71-7]